MHRWLARCEGDGLKGLNNRSHRPAHPELQSRCAAILSVGDDATIPSRHKATFGDHTESWPISVFHSADVQIAASSIESIN
jgi:hypothetical protein